MVAIAGHEPAALSVEAIVALQLVWEGFDITMLIASDTDAAFGCTGTNNFRARFAVIYGDVGDFSGAP